MTESNSPSKGNIPFATFESFYPFYLNEHRTKACKILHFIDVLFVILTFSLIAVTGMWGKLWLIPIVGYGPAWVGHFGFEKNRPASFKQPLYSLRGDFVMFWHLLSGRLPFATGAALKVK